MNTVSILIKTDPQVKENAQKTAKEMGLSLNTVVTRLLKEFSKKKEGLRSIDITSDYRAIYEEVAGANGPVAYFSLLGTHTDLYK